MLDLTDGNDCIFLHLVRHQRADDIPEQVVVLDEEETDENDREQADTEVPQGGSHRTHHRCYGRDVELFCDPVGEGLLDPETVAQGRNFSDYPGVDVPEPFGEHRSAHRGILKVLCYSLDDV